MIIDDDYDSGPRFSFFQFYNIQTTAVHLFSAIVCGFLNCSIILVLCLVPFDAPDQEDDAVTAKHSNVCMYVCACSSSSNHLGFFFFCWCSSTLEA
jgi:hypothetical protein